MERVEGWERADKAWRAKTRKRLKAIWVVMSVIFFAMVLLFLSAQYAPPAMEVPSLNSTAAKITSLLRNHTGGEVSPASGVEAETSVCGNAPTLRAQRLDNPDEMLKLFDEL
jgi:hypothetical protein